MKNDKLNNIRLIYFDIQIPNLLANSNKPFGGAAVEWITWLKALKQNKVHTALLTWRGAKNKCGDIDFEVVECFHLNKKIIFQLPFFFSALKKFNPSFIVQECANRFTGIFAILSKLLGKAFIHRIASDMDVDGRIDKYYSKAYAWFYEYGLKNASHISCQNKYQFEILKRKFPKKSISILYNPYEIKKPLNKNVKKEYVAWVGNFRYEKNLPAMAEIAKKLPQFQFKIAGTKFNKTDEDSTLGLKVLEALDNVEFVGHIKNSEITEFLSKAYCLLNTSRLEGFSNTFLEAWSVGVPVVTTKNVNPDNLIIDYNLGLVLDTYEMIPNAISELILEKGYLDFIERCYDYVSEKHNPEKLAKQFLNDMINCQK